MIGLFVAILGQLSLQVCCDGDPPTHRLYTECMAGPNSTPWVTTHVEWMSWPACALGFVDSEESVPLMDERCMYSGWPDNMSGECTEWFNPELPVDLVCWHHQPREPNRCLSYFDEDGDGDVDLRDFASRQNAWAAGDE